MYLTIRPKVNSKWIKVKPCIFDNRTIYEIGSSDTYENSMAMTN